MILLAIPFHYFATELIHKSRYNANFAKYSVWALCGTIIGIPMMGIGSFIFGFGFKLWFNLCLTGAIYGALAALMMRLMVKEDRTSEVNDFA